MPEAEVTEVAEASTTPKERRLRVLLTCGELPLRCESSEPNSLVVSGLTTRLDNC